MNLSIGIVGLPNVGPKGNLQEKILQIPTGRAVVVYYLIYRI